MLLFCESSSTSVAQLHPPPACMRRTARAPSRSRRTARSRCLASTSTAAVMSACSPPRSDSTVAWYVVYLVRECGHRHGVRKIPIRLGMSERQKDGGGECLRAMENRHAKTPAGLLLTDRFPWLTRHENLCTSCFASTPVPVPSPMPVPIPAPTPAPTKAAKLHFPNKSLLSSK